MRRRRINREGFAALLPVIDGDDDVVRDLLKTLPNGQASPFSRLSGVQFVRAVLIRFPHSHTWSVGFVTNADPEIEYKINKKILAVYVPTTPNPTSGYYLFVPEEETIPLDLHVDQALKMVVTMGIAKTESGLINLAEVSKVKG